MTETAADALVLNPEAHITSSTLARLLDCTTRTVEELTEKRLLVRAKRGRYRLSASLALYIAHLREMAAGRGSTGQADLAAERALLAREQRRAVEIKNAVSDRELVAVTAVVQVVEEDYTIVRERLLAIPGRLADVLDQASADRVMDQINEALSELHEPADAGDVAGWLAAAEKRRSDQGTPGAPAGAPPEPDPVG